MKQKVWLTTEPNAVENTVHVDDVNISEGVYYVTAQNKWFVGYDRRLDACRVVQPDDIGDKQFSKGKTLRELMDKVSGTFYTLSGTRIVTEKRLTMADLKDGNHVGFVTKNGKGHILSVKVGHNTYSFICVIDNEIIWYKQELSHSVKSSIECLPDKLEVWTFPTLKLLHNWLSE